MSDPAVRSECDRSRRPDLRNAEPARVGPVKQGRRPPRQRLVLDQTEHAGNIPVVGESITRAVSVTPAVCPIYWWQNIRKVMHVFQGERGHRTMAVPSSRKLWRALREVDTYLRGQSMRLVNYAKRYRAGLRVGTSMTEGTANFLVNQRMNKAQQMRWSRQSADLLLQVRCAVYNGAFGSGFGKLFEPTSNRVQQSPLAA